MKTLRGTVVSLKMQNTVLVEVVNRVPHPMYKKLMKHSKNYKVDTREVKPGLGDIVEIEETVPVSKNKNFKIKTIIRSEGDKK